MLAIQILINIFLSNTMSGAIFEALYIVGVWKMFEKSGVTPWHALVPCLREYTLSRCAGREDEGHVVAVTEFFVVAYRVLLLFKISESLALMIDVIAIVISLIELIYLIRIYSGLIEVFHVRRRWIVLWIFGKWIPALIWGFKKSYQPSWKVEEIREEFAKLVSHGPRAMMTTGLSVDLRERTVIEYFHKKYLLRDISLDIPSGHMVLLLGGSGAGKTTFLNAVNGYEPANATVLLNGSNIYKEYKKMQYEVGFVPQQELMREKDTVGDTLMDSAKLRLPINVPAAERKNRVEEVMGMFGLTHARTHLVEKLSGGQKKRLSIAMEFISSPSLFILDEPDSGLDGVMARELMQHLREIADTGKIVIVITHTPDRVIDLFDDVIVLAKDAQRVGRLAYYGSIENARTFFNRNTMEEIVKSINRKEEGGDGMADEYIAKYAEVRNG